MAATPESIESFNNHLQFFKLFESLASCGKNAIHFMLKNQFLSHIFALLYLEDYSKKDIVLKKWKFKGNEGNNCLNHLGGFHLKKKDSLDISQYDVLGNTSFDYLFRAINKILSHCIFPKRDNEEMILTEKPPAPSAQFTMAKQNSGQLPNPPLNIGKIGQIQNEKSPSIPISQNRPKIEEKVVENMKESANRAEVAKQCNELIAPIQSAPQGFSSITEENNQEKSQGQNPLKSAQNVMSMQRETGQIREEEMHSHKEMFTSNISSKAYAIPKEEFNGIRPKSKDDIEYLFSLARGRIGMNEVAETVCSFCKDDMVSTQMILEVIMEGCKQKKDYKEYYVLLEKYFLINDSLQPIRVKIVYVKITVKD